MMGSRLLSFGLLLALLAGWEAFVRLTGVSALVIPPPSAVFEALWDGLAVGFLWPHIWVTGAETLLGFGLGCAIGFACGVLLGEIDGLRRLLWPYVLASQVVPKLALGPIFIVWFGFGMTSTVVITSLICFFPLLENTLTGLQSAAPEKRDLFRMLGATRLQTLLRLKIPSGLPLIAPCRLTHDARATRDTPATHLRYWTAAASSWRCTARRNSTGSRTFTSGPCRRMSITSSRESA